MRASTHVVATLALTSIAVAGCHHAPPDNAFAFVSAEDQRGDVSATFDFGRAPDRDAAPTIQIPEGAAVALDVALIAVSGGTLQGTLQSANPNVLQVIPDDGNGYGFLGAGAGATTLAIVINGQTVQTIPVTVSAPPASSIPPSIDAGALFALQNMDETNAGAPEAGDVDAAVPDASAIDATVGDGGVGDATVSDASGLDGTLVDASADGDDTEGGLLEDAGFLERPDGGAD
jgi:hypothetical protein